MANTDKEQISDDESIWYPLEYQKSQNKIVQYFHKLSHSKIMIQL